MYILDGFRAKTLRYIPNAPCYLTIKYKNKPDHKHYQYGFNNYILGKTPAPSKLDDQSCSGKR